MGFKLNLSIVVDKLYDQTYLLLENGEVVVLNETASDILMEVVTSSESAISDFVYRKYDVPKDISSTVTEDVENVITELKSLDILIAE